MWISLPLTLGASLGLALLVKLEVSEGYVALSLAVVVGIVSVVARRVADGELGARVVLKTRQEEIRTLGEVADALFAAVSGRGRTPIGVPVAAG